MSENLQQVYTRPETKLKKFKMYIKTMIWKSTLQWSRFHEFHQFLILQGIYRYAGNTYVCWVICNRIASKYLRKRRTFYIVVVDVSEFSIATVATWRHLSWPADPAERSCGTELCHNTSRFLLAPSGTLRGSQDVWGTVGVCMYTQTTEYDQILAGAYWEKLRLRRTIFVECWSPF